MAAQRETALPSFKPSSISLAFTLVAGYVGFHVFGHACRRMI
jgi:hypothetical protein